jgi:cobalamin-dependent methionine synthase I
MGSVLVEDMAAKFHRRMKKKFQAEDKAVTIRLSPGYCDWLLEEQRKIFSLLDADKVGVELTDSYLMKPRKSISGIFGIMPSTKRHSYSPYNPCSECEKVDCIARRDAVLEKEKELLSS